MAVDAFLGVISSFVATVVIIILSCIFIIVSEQAVSFIIAFPSLSLSTWTDSEDWFPSLCLIRTLKVRPWKGALLGVRFWERMDGDTPLIAKPDPFRDF